MTYTLTGSVVDIVGAQDAIDLQVDIQANQPVVQDPAGDTTVLARAAVTLDEAGGFTVELARSGLVIQVPPGKTILDAVLDQGVDAPYSCTEGVCATCETRVLAGIPDHRDVVLSPEEQASNQTMMICCSGSLTPELTLDL